MSNKSWDDNLARVVISLSKNKLIVGLIAAAALIWAINSGLADDGVVRLIGEEARAGSGSLRMSQFPGPALTAEDFIP